MTAGPPVVTGRKRIPRRVLHRTITAKSGNEVPASGLSPGSAALVEFAYVYNGLDAVDCAQGRRSECVSADVAHELRQRCDLQMRDVPSNKDSTTP